MIPKVIHYIWIGGNPEPKLLQKCKKSWKKYCPDYEIKRWDESNLDLSKYQFAKDAYDAKKWAFASDVIRFDVLNEFGGVYLDTDVELLKPIDEFLKNDFFVGFEDNELINPGLIIGCIPHHKVCEDMLNVYQNKKFDINNLADITICKFVTTYFEEVYGLQANGETQTFKDATVYSFDYFCPKQLNNDDEFIYTENTHSIHHYAGSWTPKLSFKAKMFNVVKKTIRCIIGPKLYIKLKKKIKKKLKKDKHG